MRLGVRDLLLFYHNRHNLNTSSLGYGMFFRGTRYVHRIPALSTPFRALKCTRTISTSTLDPAIRDFAKDLATRQPCFPVLARNVKILSEPPEFLQLLLVRKQTSGI